MILEEEKVRKIPKLFKYQIQEIISFFNANQVFTKARCLSKSYHELVRQILPLKKFKLFKLYIPSEFVSPPSSEHFKIIL